MVCFVLLNCKAKNVQITDKENKYSMKRGRRDYWYFLFSTILCYCFFGMEVIDTKFNVLTNKRHKISKYKMRELGGIAYFLFSTILCY